MGKIPILFLLTFFCGLAATFTIDISWGVYLWIVEYFFNPKIRWWYNQLPSLRYSFLIAISIVITFIFQYKKYSENRLFAVPQTKWLIAICVMCGLINFWAAWQEMHYTYWLGFLKLLILIAIVYKVIDTPEKFDRMLWAYMLGAFYIGWVAYSMGGRTSGGRMEGIGLVDGIDVNDVSAALVSVVPIILYRVFYEKKIIAKGVALVVLAFVLNMLILGNSRGAFIGLVGGSAYFFLRILFSRIPRQVKKTSQMLALACIGVGLFVYLTDAMFWERMMSLGDAKEQAAAGGGRTYFWLKTFDLVKDHPFGVGIMGYQYLSPNFIPVEMMTMTEFGARRAVHSTIFQTLAEYGYLGFVLVGGMIASNFLFVWKTQKYLRLKEKFSEYLQAIALEAGLISFLLPCIFIDRLYAQSLYLNIVFIACFGNIFMFKQQVKEDVHG
jgi:hypothetical protein